MPNTPIKSKLQYSPHLANRDVAPRSFLQRGEEQNREEGEMAQKSLGGGRDRGKSRREREKEKLGVGRIELGGPG